MLKKSNYILYILLVICLIGLGISYAFNRTEKDGSDLGMQDLMVRRPRPQDPLKPYPYNEEEVNYENKNAGIKLAATLTYPKSEGPFSAVVLLTGSGQQNRDLDLFGHKFFLVLADYLTRQGIAVLRADDRGIGGSTGNFDQSTTGDFADDALAGVEYLKRRKEIDPRRIGLVGLSEGGMMAPIAATRSSDVAFIVMMAGPGVGLDEVVIYQKLEQFKLQGANEEDVSLMEKWLKSIYAEVKNNSDSLTAEKKIRELYTALSEEEKNRLNWSEPRLNTELHQLLSPWWRYGLSYDPRATLINVKCPVLAINGSKDVQVLSKNNLPAIEAALKSGGNKNYLVKELPGLNHPFQTANTGAESEYAYIEESMSPDAMQLIASWILEQAK